MKRILTIAAIALLAACTKKDNKQPAMTDAEMQSLLIDKKWQLQKMWGRDGAGNMLVDDASTWPEYDRDDYTIWKGTMKFYSSTNGTSSHGPVSDTADYGHWLLNNGAIIMTSEKPTSSGNPNVLNVSDINASEFTCWGKTTNGKVDTIWFNLKVIP